MAVLFSSVALLAGLVALAERFINTPSLHRVHHAINPQYLDRNHGGTLMVWDHLFGTYQREEEACVYGMTRPLASSWSGQTLLSET